MIQPFNNYDKVTKKEKKTFSRNSRLWVKALKIKWNISYRGIISFLSFNRATVLLKLHQIFEVLLRLFWRSQLSRIIGDAQSNKCFRPLWPKLSILATWVNLNRIWVLTGFRELASIYVYLLFIHLFTLKRESAWVGRGTQGERWES